MFTMGAVCGSPRGSKTVRILEIIENGNFKGLKKLILEGADVNITTYSGYTALMHAASSGHVQCLDLLVRAGADLNLSTNHGTTALLEAVMNDFGECVQVLIKAGADVNARDGQRALCHAITNGNVRCLNMMIKAGADVNVPIKEYKTPLMVALEKKQSDCATLLIEAGADTECLDLITNSRVDVNASGAGVKHSSLSNLGADVYSSSISTLGGDVNASGADVNDSSLSNLEADITSSAIPESSTLNGRVKQYHLHSLLDIHATADVEKEDGNTKVIYDNRNVRIGNGDEKQHTR